MKIKSINLIGTALVLSLIWNCSKNENLQTGNLSVLLTDKPFPTDLISNAEVTISKVEIRQKDSEGNPFITLMEKDATFNLLELRNGVTASLSDTQIQAGFYDLVRIYVKEARIVLSNNDVVDVKVPSGAQTGIKVFIKPGIEVAGGLTSELLLDFDVSNSFVVLGKMDTAAGIKGFNFKPVIKATNLSTTGSLVGEVTDTTSVLLEGVQISVFAEDTLNTTTFTDTDGKYAVLGLTEGYYDIQAEKEGYVSQKYEDITVISANTTKQNFELVPE